jgi:hypothetical protein
LLRGTSPTASFIGRHFISLDDALATDAFFREHYGAGDEGADQPQAEVPGAAAWRRIDGEWLYSAQTLAFRLNRGIDNTSLVLAFELPESRKVLLFIGDAQRGNWLSWTDHSWTEGDRTVTARDLLARRVLYAECSTRLATTGAITRR